MTNNVVLKVQERIEMLEAYSRESTFGPETSGLDVIHALLAFNCKTVQEITDKLVFVINRFMSVETRECCLAGLNLDRYESGTLSFSERLQACATKLGCSYAAAEDRWSYGVSIISEQFETGMRLSEVNKLIGDPSVSPEATAAISWLVDEFIQKNRER